MPKFRGKDLIVIWLSGGGTAVVTGQQTDFKPDRTAQTIDVTAGSSLSRERILGLKDGKAKLTFYDSGTAIVGATSLMGSLAVGAQGTLVWGPIGSATGNPKYGVAAIVTKNDADYPFDKAATREIDWDNSLDYLFDGDSGSVWP